MLNMQDAYEAIREYFTQPGAVRAVSESGFCRYRVDDFDPTSPACAIGCLIPNELYHPTVEGGSLGSLLNQIESDDYDNAEVRTALSAIFGNGFSIDNVKGSALFCFLVAAQNKHDRNLGQPVSEFVAELDNLAVAYNLAVV